MTFSQTFLLLFYSSSSFSELIFFPSPLLELSLFPTSPDRSLVPFCPSLYYSLIPSLSTTPFDFPVFYITPGQIITVENLQLGTQNGKEYVTFIFLDLGYLAQYNLFQFHIFAFKFHDFISLYCLIVFHNIYVPYFYYPFCQLEDIEVVLISQLL